MYELDEDTRLEPAGDGRFRGHIADRWSIGTVPNGGYVLAVGLAAIARSVAPPDPIVATAYYLRPTLTDDVEVAVEIVKTGKRYVTAEARFVQHGDECVRILATFGTLPPPDSGPVFVDRAPPPMPPREACVIDRPAIGVPEIAKRFDMVIDPESAPYLEGKRGSRAELRAEARFKDGRPTDLWSLAVFADAFPPPAFNVIPMGWVPTLELTVSFRAHPAPGFVRGRFTTHFVFGGHLDEDGELWDATGRLVALSRQMAVMPR